MEEKLFFLFVRLLSLILTFGNLMLLLKELFEIIESISVIIAAAVAVYGINTWRRESVWKRKSELLEQTITSLYRAKDALMVIRNPFSYLEEGKTRQKMQNEKEEYSGIIDAWFAVFERYEREKEPFQELRSIKYQFVVYFGKTYLEDFNKVDETLNKIFSSSKKLIRKFGRKRGAGYSLTDKEIDEVELLEGFIWTDYADSDPITQSIDSVIEKFELLASNHYKDEPFIF